MKVILHINGVEMKVPSELGNMTELIEHLGLNSPVMIVEHNGAILQKENISETTLTTGDEIEFVQFVGGG